jgi:hypothetical protein
MFEKSVLCKKNCTQDGRNGKFRILHKKRALHFIHFQLMRLVVHVARTGRQGINTVTWMARALLGKGPVNTPRPNTHKATI